MDERTNEQKRETFRRLLREGIEKAISDSGYLGRCIVINPDGSKTDYQEALCHAADDFADDYDLDDYPHSQGADPCAGSADGLEPSNFNKESSKFNIGDIVVLNTGGVAMNVANINHQSPLLLCMWMNQSGDIINHFIPASCLSLFQEGSNE